MPNWKERNQMEQIIDKEIYKIPLDYKNQLIKIKKHKNEIKLERYHNYLIEAAGIAFSKEAVDKLNQTFTSMRKNNKTSFEKCVCFVKKIEMKEKEIVKNYSKQKTMFNKIFYELSDKKKENLINSDIKFYSVLKSKKASKSC